jgi:hypothetical protein
VAKPTFQVIKGSWVAASKWLDFPGTVDARSPFNRDVLCAFRIGREDAVKQAPRSGGKLLTSAR